MHAVNTPFFLLVCAMAACLAPQSPQAGPVELRLDADRCAIEYALTGRRGGGCPALSPAAFGVARSLPPNGGFSRAAAGLRSLEEERGYFVRFAFNSDSLTPEYAAHLDRLSAVLQSPALAESCLKLVGHADSVGPPAFNSRLSGDRAAQVATYLVAKGGVHPQRILTEARGESQLLPDIPGPHPRNRRVEILARSKPANGCQ